MRLAMRSACSENFCPWRSSTDKRHISTPADANSITLSRPKATSTRLPAVTPAPTAMTASTVIHPIVSHSSPNASRMSGSRSDCGGKKSGGGAQASAMREEYPNQGPMSAVGLVGFSCFSSTADFRFAPKADLFCRATSAVCGHPYTKVNSPFWLLDICERVPPFAREGPRPVHGGGWGPTPAGIGGRDPNKIWRR